MYPIDTAADIRRHDVLADMAEKVAERLIRTHGMQDEQAIDVGNDIADFMAATWKGQSIYFVGEEKFKLLQRDWEIYKRMERGNAHELAKEYGISYVRVYQIYKRCLAEVRRRTQHDLFTPQPTEATNDTDADAA